VPLYEQLLDYRVVDAGCLPEDLTRAWNTPAMAGMRYATLQPASGAEVYLRFIATGNTSGYWPPVTQGWVATEILTTDPDAVLDRLRGSAFTHIGGPAALYDSPRSARALQMAGPAGELMYFTRLWPNGSRFGLHGARSFVDRPFIMVVGGTSLAEINAFYRDKLGLRVIDQPPFKIRQMSRVLGVSEETAYPISLARLPGRSFLLELEELPAGIAPRTVPEGQLPEGLAMVSFAAASLDELQLQFRAQPQRIGIPPYNGRRVAVTEGAAGEWLELID
jgi:catechol 2,3-dioxygenase-like lactoylglutathione lyase family enzyme